MNFAAIVHRPTEDDIHPSGRDALTVDLTTARGDFQNVYLLYWPRYENDAKKRQKIKMKIALQDAYRDYYRSKILTEDISAYTRYCFRMESDQGTVWYGSRGFETSEPGMQENFFEFLWPNPTDCDQAPVWAKDQIYYQIFPERFFSGDPSITPANSVPWGAAPTRENFMGGDLRGIIEKLDYIQALGVTCIYLTPIFKAPSNHKYDTVDYYEIDPAFGTKEDLRELVAEIHRRGMRLLLDGVFNHCGFYWPYFQDVIAKGEQSDYCDWFFPHSFPVTTEPCNYDCVGHYKWMPKINLANPEAERYFISVGEYWIREFAIDGWRLDVADEIPTAFWTAFSTALRRLNPEILLLGETWGDARRLVSGDRLDTAMNYLFRDIVCDWLAKDGVLPSWVDHRINRMLALYTEEVDLRMYNLLDSHDTARFRYLCKNKERHKLAVALQMTFPGCPAVYYGDEVGLSGDNDPGCRMAMEWDEQRQDQELLAWYKMLIQIRSQSPSLRYGQYRTAFYDDTANVFAFYRIHESEMSLIVLNAGEKPYPVTLGEGVWQERIAQPDTDCTTGISPDQTTELAACSVGIYQKKVKVQK